MEERYIRNWQHEHLPKPMSWLHSYFHLHQMKGQLYNGGFLSLGFPHGQDTWHWITALQIYRDHHQGRIPFQIDGTKNLAYLVRYKKLRGRVRNNAIIFRKQCCGRSHVFIFIICRGSCIMGGFCPWGFSMAKRHGLEYLFRDKKLRGRVRRRERREWIKKKN